MEKNAQVVIDDRFFEVAARQSSRYPRLWVITKETLQNSQDAGAKNVRFDLAGDWATIEDDGPGMGPTGGIENFLTIGASQKNSSGSTVGYFSTAKVRICFIHKDWRILTNDEYLEKSMLGNEPIRPLVDADVVDGCVIQVRNRNGPWNEAEILDYLDLCNTKCTTWVNGKKQRETYRRGTYKTKFSWGQVYVNKGKKAHLGRLVVRVAGLAMFTGSLPDVKAQVTVEVNTEHSYLVLRETREGLVWSTTIDGKYTSPSEDLDKFAESLVANPSSLVEERQTIEFVRGRLRNNAARPDTDASLQEVSAGSETYDVKGLTLSTVAEWLSAGKIKQIDQSGSLVELADGEYGWRFSGTLDIETSLPTPLEELFEVTDPFLNLFPYDYIYVYEGKKRPKVRLKDARVLHAWHGVCLTVANLFGISSAWGVGLTNSEKAMWLRTEHGNFLLIDSSEIKTTSGQLPTTMRLLKLACHELAHVLGHSDHNERFIMKEHEIFECAIDNLKTVREATKGLTVYSR